MKIRSILNRISRVKKYARIFSFFGLMILGLFVLAISSYAVGKYIYIKSMDYARNSVVQEQEKNKKDLMDNLQNIEAKIDSIEASWSDLQDKNRILLDQKKSLLLEMDYLQKDARIFNYQNIDYQNNVSIQLNPWRDRSVDMFFDKTWFLETEIERLCRQIEYGLYRGFFSGEQNEIIRKGFSDVRWQIDKIKNAN